MSEKKYIITNQKKVVSGTIAYRIKAVRDIPRQGVKCGDEGGWVESESNLSQSGDAWIGGDAAAIEGALVSGDALVCDRATVCGNAIVCERAIVWHDACVCGTAAVGDDAEVFGEARVGGDAFVYGNAQVYDVAEVSGNAQVRKWVQVRGAAQVRDNACLDDYAVVECVVGGEACIGGDAAIIRESDYMSFRNTWSSKRVFTYTRSNRMWRVGCFYGTGKELIAKAYKDSDLSGKCYEATVRYVEAIYKEIEAEGGAK